MNRQFFRIEGNKVEKVEERIVKTCDTEDFLYQCQMMSNVSTDILPRNCIAVRYNGKTKLTVLELTPRTVPVKYRASGGQLHELVISIPFVQFYQVTYGSDASLGSVYISCTKKRVMSFDDPIYILPVLNQYGDGNSYVCTGSIALPVEMPVSEKIERFIGAFFDAEFNHDLNMSYPSKFTTTVDGKRVQGMMGWSAQTEKNKMFGLSKEVEYRQHGYKTVDGLMNYILENHRRD